MTTTLVNQRNHSYRDDPAVPAFDDSHPLVVFDGHCVFCSGWARFLLKRDRQQRYRLAIAQTPLGEALYRHYCLDARDYETNLLIENGRAYVKSEATIRMIGGLGLPWSLLRILQVVPVSFRDAIYGFVARHRFKIAGRRESCYLPTPEERGRFL